MTQPRVDLKIGIDFEKDLSVAVADKFKALADDVNAAFSGKAAAGAQQISAAVKETAVASDQARDRLRDYGAAGSALTGIWAGWQLVRGAVMSVASATTAAASALLDAQIFAERFAITMKLATGGDAGREMDYIRGLANRLGVELKSTAGYYALFTAASRETAIEGEQTKKIFEAVSKASAVMGLSAYDTEGVFRALTQMISKGTVQAEEMRGQLGERLPGAFQIAARSMGVTTREFSKMLETGQVITAEFLPRFAEQLNREFAGSVEQASQRTAASLERFNTAWLDVKTTVANAGVGSFIAGQVNILTDAFNDLTGSMRRAREGGGGFWGEWTAALGAVARFVNPLNAVSYQTQDVTVNLGKARRELADLETALQSQPNNLILRNAIKDTRELVAELERAQQRGTPYRDQFERPGQAAQIAARVQAERDLAKAGDDVLRIQQRLSGQAATFFPTLMELKKAYDLGALSLGNYQRLVGELIEKEGGVARARKEAAPAASAEKIDDARRALAQYIDQLDRQQERVEDLSEVEKAAGFLRSIGMLGEVDQVRTLVMAQAERVDALREERRAAAELLTTQNAIAAARAAEVARLNELTGRSEMDRLNRDLRLLNDAYEQGDIALEEYIAGYRKAFGADARAEVEKTNDAARELGLTFSSAFEDAIVGGKDLGEVLDGLEKDILRIVTRKLVTEPLANAVTGAIGSGGGAGGLFGGILGAIFGGAQSQVGIFGNGGYLEPGHWGIVGDKGPELAYGGRSGATIVPNAGATTINQTFVLHQPASLRTQQQLAANARRGLAAALDRNLAGA